MTSGSEQDELERGLEDVGDTTVEEGEGPRFGQEFAGKYFVGEKIGSGGYGEVYRAEEIELGRPVALKVMRPGDAESEADRKRFQREAKIVAKLSEPTTVTLFDYGENEGRLYLAYEFVEGKTVGEWVEERGPMRPLEVLKMLEQVLDSLREAHERGIVHRDIKPANIMLYEHDRRGLGVKVLDFGIGKWLEGEDKDKTKLTREGSMMGTPRYMPPEQMKGQDVGPATDLWAMGVVSLEALMGRHVVQSSNSMEVSSAILDSNQEPFVVPGDVDVPPFFREILEKLMKKSKGERYSCADAVLEDIAELKRREENTPVGEQQIVSRDRAQTSSGGQTQESETHEEGARSEEGGEEQNGWIETVRRVGVLTGVISVLLGVGVWWVSSGVESGGESGAESSQFIEELEEQATTNTSGMTSVVGDVGGRDIGADSGVDAGGLDASKDTVGDVQKDSARNDVRAGDGEGRGKEDTGEPAQVAEESQRDQERGEKEGVGDGAAGAGGDEQSGGERGGEEGQRAAGKTRGTEEGKDGEETTGENVENEGAKDEQSVGSNEKTEGQNGVADGEETQKESGGSEEKKQEDVDQSSDDFEVWGVE